MARGFIGDDERLTPSERRLLSAAFDEANEPPTVSDRALSLIEGFQKALKFGPAHRRINFQEELAPRTREELGRALDKLERLRKEAEGDIRDRAADAEERPPEPKRPSGVSDARRTLFERGKTERTMGLRRDRMASDE